jgi:SAM-dependent methyltransferase
MPESLNRSYDADLAYIHHVGFGSFARKSAAGLLQLLRKYGVKSGLVVDIGCGSGIWAERLLRSGHEVLGVDLSPAMLAMARLRAPQAKFVRASFLDFAFPECAAVTAMGEVLCYALDRRNTRAQLGRMVRRVHAALRPGGILIFDVAEPGRGADLPAKFYWKGKDWALLREAVEDPKRCTLTRNMTIFRQVAKRRNASYRRSAESHRLNLYSRAEVKSELARAGFEVEMLSAYGKDPFPAHLAGFVARKQG